MLIATCHRRAPLVLLVGDKPDSILSWETPLVLLVKEMPGSILSQEGFLFLRFGVAWQHPVTEKPPWYCLLRKTLTESCHRKVL